VGAVEIGLILAADARALSWEHLSAAVLLTPPALYGGVGLILGWLVGPRGQGWSWYGLLLLAGVVVQRAHPKMLSGWPWVGAGLVVFLVLWKARAVLGRLPVYATGLLGLAGFLAPLIAVLVAMSDERPRVDRQPGEAVVASAGRSPDVVLVTWDTVRADMLPAFGGGGLDTPAFDRLVEEGILFTDFQAVASITAPAHTSMLTGLYPPSHGLRSNGDRSADLPQARLPELFAAAGYVTAGFTSTYCLRREFGFERGFHVYDDRSLAPWSDLLKGALQQGSAWAALFLSKHAVVRSVTVPGEMTVARAIDWLQEVRQPAFLWVHFYDAHYPYDPPAEFRERALQRASEPPQAVLATSHAPMVLQRGEVELLDQLLGELLTQLDDRDPGLENTIVVVVSDHGECFGEGGLGRSHHRSLYGATQHVFAALRPAGSMQSLPRGQRVKVPSSQVDLLPTLAELAGLPVPEELHGRSLLPDMVGEEGARRGLYMEAYSSRLGERRLQGWVEDGWKLIRAVEGDELLFHLQNGETDNLAKREPERLIRMRQALQDALDSMRTIDSRGSDLSLEDERALRTLGYLDDS
jgi:arylsulfatase A-like enzyme